MTELEALQIVHRVQRRLLDIEQALDVAELNRKGEPTVIDPKVAALITQFDNATNAIAAKIQKLIDAGGLSAESEAALQVQVDRLKTLGADPANPVPQVPA